MRVVPGNCCRDVLHDGIRSCSGTLGVSFGMQTILCGMRGANFNALRAILEPLGVHLGGSGRGSGGSWGALWGVRGRLGAILGCLGAILEAILRQRDFRMFFESILESFWVLQGVGQMKPKLDPKRTKIEDEKEDASINFASSSLEGLGAVLERSWVDLGRT